MLYLKDTPINQILSMNEMIEAVEDTLKEVALGRGFELPRRRIHHPNRMIFGLLPGSVHGAMGAYLQTDLDRRIHHETVIFTVSKLARRLFYFKIAPLMKIGRLRRGPSAPSIWPEQTLIGWLCSAAPSTRKANSKRSPPSET